MKSRLYHYDFQNNPEKSVYGALTTTSVFFMYLLDPSVHIKNINSKVISDDALNDSDILNAT